MTQPDMSLILLALHALSKIERKRAILRAKKPANALTRRVFNLVAGARNHLNLLLTAQINPTAG
jgi:hypothetical protein